MYHPLPQGLFDHLTHPQWLQINSSLDPWGLLGVKIKKKHQLIPPFFGGETSQEPQIFLFPPTIQAHYLPKLTLEMLGLTLEKELHIQCSHTPYSIYHEFIWLQFKFFFTFTQSLLFAVYIGYKSIYYLEKRDTEPVKSNLKDLLKVHMK